MPTIRKGVPEEASIEAIIKDLDMADKLREVAAVHIASYQQRLVKLHNRRVRSRTFKVRELVLRRVFENKSNPKDGKFQPNWEGPYIVVRGGPTGSCALNRPDGTAIPRIWNGMHLKKYY